MKQDWTIEKAALWTIWEQLDPDLMAGLDEHEDRLSVSKEEVIEVVLDANRPETSFPNICWASFYALSYEERKAIAAEIFTDDEYYV